MGEWRSYRYCGARFWKSPRGSVRARIHLTPEGDYYWDVAIVEHGFTIVDQGRVGNLSVAKALAAGAAGRESRKRLVGSDR